MLTGDMDVVKAVDRLDSTLLEVLNELREHRRLQRETNELLKRLGATVAQVRDKG